ncbi:MAG: histone H1 [bacterium]
MAKRKKTPKRPRDVNQLAKRIVDLSVGSAEEEEPTVDRKAVARGKARAEKLTAEERSEIARKAAKARWNK